MSKRAAKRSEMLIAADYNELIVKFAPPLKQRELWSATIPGWPITQIIPSGLGLINSVHYHRDARTPHDFVEAHLPVAENLKRVLTPEESIGLGRQAVHSK